MRIFRCHMLITLAIAFCLGCGDSSSQQPWEKEKSQASGGKPAAKSDDVANNAMPGDDMSTSPEISRETPKPSGSINPHAGLAKADAPSATIENNGKLDAGAVHWTVPKTWIRKEPKPSIVQTLAEYGIPKTDGDKDDGRLTVTKARGTLEDNVARWKRQFGKSPDEKSEEAVDVSGVKVTLVDLSGTFQDSRGMMGPVVERPDYRMLGAILQIAGDDDLTFIKCYGPTKTMAAHADEVKAFIRSMKVDK